MGIKVVLSLKCLEQIGDVHGHLLNLGGVVTLELLELGPVLLGDEIDRDTFTTETTRATDTMEVVLEGGGEIEVHNQRHLLDIDTTSQKIGGDQHTGGTGAELAHNEVTFLLVEIGVHGGDGEITLTHFLGEPVDLSAGVAVDDGLGDREGLVKIAKGVELPVLLLDGDEELTDTFEGKLILLDENANGVAHELLGKLHGLRGHGGGEKGNLDVRGHALEDIVDLILETTGKHLIGLIEDEDADVVEAHVALVDHVVNAAGGTDDEVLALLELLDVLADGSTTDAGVDLDLHVITEGEGDLLDLKGKLTGGGLL